MVGLFEGAFGKPPAVGFGQLPDQALGGQAQRGDRRPQLVREIGDELLAYCLQPAELGQVIDEGDDLAPPVTRDHGHQDPRPPVD